MSFFLNKIIPRVIMHLYKYLRNTVFLPSNSTAAEADTVICVLQD